MMLLNKSILKTVFLTVFLLSNLSGVAKPAKTSKSSVPDFAFPKTVVADADRELHIALKSKNPTATLRALMNLTVASSLISHENAPATLQLMDSVNALLQPPFVAVGYLVKASMLSEIYQSDAYTFDRRIFSDRMSDENVMLWSRKEFALSIDSLLNRALAEKGAASTTPLSTISGLIISDYPIDSFTVYDFIVYKTIELNSSMGGERIIPFFDTQQNRIDPLALTNELLALHPDNSRARTAAILKRFDLLPVEKGEEYLRSAIRECGDSEYAVPLLVAYYNNYGGRKSADPSSLNEASLSPAQIYALAFNLKGNVKGKEYLKQLNNLISSLSAPTVALNFLSTVCTGSNIEVTVDADNISDFYILLLKTESQDDNRYSKAELSKLKVADTRKIHLKGTIPFSITDTLCFSINNPGTYTFAASSSPRAEDIIGLQRYFYPTLIQVSDIDIISISPTIIKDIPTEASQKRNPEIFVVNAQNGSPVKGAKVVFEDQSGRYNRIANPKRETVETSVEGLARSPFENASATATFNGSTARSWVNRYQRREVNGEQIRFFTDRSVYHPKDTVRFLGVLFDIERNAASLQARRAITVKLRNANYETVDSLQLESDASGRITGEFALPAEGLLGVWSIGDGEFLQAFELAEYTAPTVMISLEKSSSTGNEIEFKGIAATYSGMPLAGVEVDYSVDFMPRFAPYYRNVNRESFHSSVKTDADGEYTITLPLSNLNPKEYNGAFVISATVKDAGGETARSRVQIFSIADTYLITPSIPEKIEAVSDSILLTVTVKDLNQLPVEKRISYTVSDSKGGVVLKGTFTSPLLKLDAASLPSGKYSFRFFIEGSIESETEVSTVIYRLSDSKPPVETCVWLPETEFVTHSGASMVEIPFGCSYPGQQILCYISDSKGNEEYCWIVSDGTNVKVEVPAPADDERKFVTFMAFRNHNFKSGSVTLIPEFQKKKLTVKTESFRNKMMPGVSETWKFTMEYDGKPHAGYAYAVMYDQALDAVAPLRWNTILFTPSYPRLFNIGGNSAYTSSDYFDGGKAVRPYFQEQTFAFQTYNYPLYGYGYRMYNLARSMSVKKADMNMTMADESVMESAVDTADDVAVETETVTVAQAPLYAAGAVDAGAAPEQQEVQYRDIECPVAFFRPLLSTDREGQLSVEFTVPDFNTTWNFLMGAYDDNLQSGQLQLQAVASKPVMVKMLAPRFLRTGDKAVITGQIFNNSEENAVISGRFEVFNPYTGEVLAKSDSNGLTISPMGRGMVEICYECPSDMNVVGIRLFAGNHTHTDGEQTVIPVLPSSQPVVESTPFYLSADSQKIEIPIPEFEDGALVTFKYCDNPTWLAVTALPPIIEPENETLTSLLAAFYANSTASGLIRRHPSIRKGLEMIVNGEAGDSILISNLDKNNALKTVALANTPWVNDARSETLRLTRLSSLLSNEEADTVIGKLWEKILSYRDVDGGWSWCRGMKSSPWITQSLLLRFGMLKANGYLTDNKSIGATLISSLKYLDKEVVTDFNEYKGDKNGFYNSLLPYLFMRSFFPEVAMDRSLTKIKDAAVSFLAKNWKELSIDNKSICALTLHRSGRTSTAKEILKSLEQFATTDIEKGVWFDNLEGENGKAGALLSSANVLLAFDEISPDSPLISGLRQWILLQKQAQSWQEGYWSIDVINALLCCGKDWTPSTSLPPVITIDGKPLPIDKLGALTGEVTIDIPATGKRNRKISIVRESPAPAWGGLISQYVAPMEDIRAKAAPGISVRKEFLKIIESPDGVSAVPADNIKPGDKIRVTLIVENDRSLDFAALTDERPACLQPSDQLSGFTVIDGIGCYKEEGLNSTNIFFGNLPRGHHIISYECRVREGGEFAAGVATLQSFYSPLLTAHSGGSVIKISAADLED